MNDDFHEVLDEITTWSKNSSFFPDRKIYFPSLFMSNYKLGWFFFFLLLSNIIYIKQQRVKPFLGFTQIAASLVLIQQRKSNFGALGTYILPRDKMGLRITAISTIYHQSYKRDKQLQNSHTINFSNFQLASLVIRQRRV